MLYMFQTVFPPIIRSSHCTYSIWYMSSLLAATASVGELAVPRHTLMMHGTMNVKSVTTTLSVHPYARPFTQSDNHGADHH